MLQRLDENMFVNRVLDSEYRNKYSIGGLKAMYRDIEELYEKEYVLDLGYLAMVYAEFENLEDYNKDTGTEYESMEELRRNQTVLMIDEKTFLVA